MSNKKQIPFFSEQTQVSIGFNQGQELEQIPVITVYSFTEQGFLVKDTDLEAAVKILVNGENKVAAISLPSSGKSGFVILS